MSEAASTLERLGVGTEDAAAIVASLPDRDDDPLRWRALDRAVGALVAGLDGGWAPPRWLYDGWPLWPKPRRPGWRWFYAQLFLTATPAIGRWHAEHGVDDAVSWDTLGDVGRRVELHRLTHPEDPAGLDDPGWLVHHYRGRLFQLGRLQFLRGRGRLEIHVPAGEPLDPDAVDASLADAPRFFARHFPADSRTVARCQSWLLDPQLADYLPETSNIVAFQRRFRLVDSWRRNGDKDVVEAVFPQTGVPLNAQPCHTTLERAVVAHLDAGKHWMVRRGWCELGA